MSKNEALNLSSISANYDCVDCQIIEENTLLALDSPKANERLKLRVVLQERDVINNNKRIYSDVVLRAVVNQLSPKALARKLVGELDHPLLMGATDAEKLNRTVTVLLDKACVLFTKIEYDGRFIVAECETLTTEAGLKLYRLIKDGVQIGFSLRALGGVQKQQDGTLIVSEQIKAVTFDVVTNPSHANAGIQQIVETLNENSITTLIKQYDKQKENQILSESSLCADIFKKLETNDINQLVIHENTLYDMENAPMILTESSGNNEMNTVSSKGIILESTEEILLEMSLVNRTIIKKFSIF